MDSTPHDVTNIRKLLETLWPGTARGDIMRCTRSLITMANHLNVAAAQAGLPGVAPEGFAQVILHYTTDRDLTRSAVEQDTHSPLLDAQFQMFMEYHYDAEPTVTIPASVLDAVCRELTAAANIMRAVDKHLNRVERSDVRKHRGRCAELRGILERLIPTAWMFRQKDNGDQR